MLLTKGDQGYHIKCFVILSMQSPNKVKEVQQLTGQIASLSCFLLKFGDKSFLFLNVWEKNEKFAWSEKCE